MNRIIFTLGHSNHPIDFFIDLLSKYKIDTVIDVRSIPASSYNPQYNKEPLSLTLKEIKINYLFFGKEFGARHEDPDFLDENGVVDFERFRNSFVFQQGVERLDMGIEKGHKIALMCSESDPMECHRFSMISVFLENHGIRVNHILKNGSIIANKDLESDLMIKFRKKLPQPDLFNQEIDEKSQLKEAYRIHNKKIGWNSLKEKTKDNNYD